MSDFNKIYDVSPVTREAMEWRAERRKVLREKYLKYKLHPNAPTGQYPFDKLMQRYITAQICHEAVFKPNVRNFVWTVCWTILPMIGIGYVIFNSRDANEHKIRTGQVAYADRFSKFA